MRVEYTCEMCQGTARNCIGYDGGVWLCGIHKRYLLSRVPNAHAKTRHEIRARLGFIFPDVPVQKPKPCQEVGGTKPPEQDDGGLFP